MINLQIFDFIRSYYVRAIFSRWNSGRFNVRQVLVMVFGSGGRVYPVFGVVGVQSGAYGDGDAGHTA